MTAIPAVDVRHLSVERGGRTVLGRLSLEIPAGRLTGLLGPSGSGKSTLIRSIVGVQRIAHGRVVVLGEPAGSAPLRRRVGYVTQAPSVYADLTVRENVRYFGGLHGRTARDADAAIAAVDLTDRAHALTADLSGGQRSRVGLATALVAEPDVLILDEPTVGLDPVLRQQLWEQFRHQARSGRCVLVSSHVMDEATRCDDLILLREGRVLFQGTPAELLERTGCGDAESAFLTLITAGRTA